MHDPVSAQNSYKVIAAPQGAGTKPVFLSEHSRERREKAFHSGRDRDTSQLLQEVK
jgi:hypothetical protein